MCRAAAVFAFVLLAGCGRGPQALVLSGEVGRDAFECALAEATAQGYAVTDAERGVFFQARQPKRRRGGRRSGRLSDVLTATVARGQLTVIAAGERESEDGTFATDPSGAAEAEAAAVVAACTR